MVITSPKEQSKCNDQFLKDVLEGLNSKQKTLPCKYLYDETGSKIFEKICELDDYYLTRTEAQIFNEHLQDIAEKIGSNTIILEPGAGNCEKVRPLLATLRNPISYIPIDISPEILLAAKEEICKQMPTLTVQPIVGDFTHPESWGILQNQELSSNRKVIFFPGSTIGNFTPEQSRNLLSGFHTQLNAGDGLLIGADLVKDSITLERAYHDSEHVTEAFNKNLLYRINSELDADFNPNYFAHRAFYHSQRQRVEMHLVSLRDQGVNISGQKISFREAETIHTENSHKYTQADMRTLLRSSGFNPINCWTDAGNNYSVHYAEIL